MLLPTKRFKQTRCHEDTRASESRGRPRRLGNAEKNVLFSEPRPADKTERAGRPQRPDGRDWDGENTEGGSLREERRFTAAFEHLAATCLEGNGFTEVSLRPEASPTPRVSSKARRNRRLASAPGSYGGVGGKPCEGPTVKFFLNPLLQV